MISSHEIVKVEATLEGIQGPSEQDALRKANSDMNKQEIRDVMVLMSFLLDENK